MDTLFAIIGNNIATLQEMKCMSNERLAEKIGVSVRQLSRYKNMQCENMKISTLYSIADALHVDIQKLLGSS